jgi:hypothetical protein
MRTARPIRQLSRSRKIPEPWEQKIASFDRGIRRSNHKWKLNTVRIDPHVLCAVINSRTIPENMFSQINQSCESQD